MTGWREPIVPGRRQELLAEEFGIDPCSAIDPQVYGDVIGIRVRTDKAQMDRLCPGLIEYDCAG